LSERKRFSSLLTTAAPVAMTKPASAPKD
jgi:hypothetical protein